MSRLSRRDELVSVAARLLDSGGPAAVTLREVGRAAGVSHTAPYRHFADKDELLAAIAARELGKRSDANEPASLRARMLGYVRWAVRHPERFKLTFGRWGEDYPELSAAAHEARLGLEQAIAAEQQKKLLPKGDPARLASLILAAAHGAADLAIADHMSRGGKGNASPEDIVNDLFAHLSISAKAGK